MTRLTQTLEESSSTGKKLRETYANLDIEIYDQQGQLKSTFQILNELSPKWNEMSENEKKTLALTSAGSNQINNFTALMDNWGKAIDATTTALTSDGSAMRQNEAYMESLSAKTNNLKKAFSDLVLGDGGLSSFIKGIVDASTALLKFANTDLGKITIGVTALAVAFNTLYKSVKAYQEAQKLATMSDAVASLTKSVMVSGATFATYGLVIAGVSVAIYGLYKGFKYLFPSIEDTNKKLKELSQEHKNAKTEVESLNEKLKEVQSTMDKIRSKGELKITDKEDLSKLERETAELQAQLALAREKEALRKTELQTEASRVSDKHYSISLQDPTKMKKQTRVGFGDVKQWYASDTEDMWVTPTEGLKLYTEQMKQSQEVVELNNRKIADLNEQVEHGSKTYENAKKEIDDYNKQNEFALKTYNDAQKGASEFSEAVMTIADAEGKGSKEAKEAILAYGEINSKILLAGDGTNNLAVQTQSLTDAESENGDQANENADANEALQDSLTAVSKAMKPVEKAQKEYAKNGKITADTIIGIQSKAKKLDIDFTDLLSVLSDTNATTDQVNEAFGTMIMRIMESSGAFDNLNEENADLVENLLESYGVTNAYSIVQNALNDTTDGLGHTIEKVAESLKIEADGMTDLKVKVGEAEYSVSAFAQAIIDSNGQIINCSSSIANLSDLEKQAWSTAVAIQYALAFESHKKEGMIGAKAQFYARHDAESGADSLIRKMRENINNAKTSVARASSDGGKSKKSGGGGSSKSATDEYAKQWKEAYEKEQKALEHSRKMDEITEKEYYEKLKELQQKYFGESTGMHDKFIDEYRKIDEQYYDWQKKEFEDNIKYQQHVLDRQADDLSKAKSKYSKSMDKRIESLQEKADKVDDNYDEQIDAIEKRQKAETKAIQAQIDLLEKERDKNKDYWEQRINALEETNDELERQKQLQEKLEALDKAKQTRVKIFKDGRFIWDIDREKISQAQKNLNDYKEKTRQEREKKALTDARDAEQNNYEERLKALNDYKDAVDKKYDEMLDKIKEEQNEEKKAYDRRLKNLRKQKKEEEQEYQDMIDNINEWKEAHSRALEDMENAQKGFLDSSKAFVYDYNKTLEENLQAYSAYISQMQGLQSGFMIGANGELIPVEGGGVIGGTVGGGGDYKNIKDWSNPSAQHDAWVSAGSPSSTPTKYVPDGKGGSAPSSSTADKYGGVVSKKYTIHAKGVASVADNEMAVVGENPNKEIVVGSKVNNGVLMNLDKGAGVVNAKSTRTFAGLVNSIGSDRNLVNRDTQVVQTFNFGNISLPNVTDANSFAQALSTRFNNFAIQYGNKNR